MSVKETKKYFKNTVQTNSDREREDAWHYKNNQQLMNSFGRFLMLATLQTFWPKLNMSNKPKRKYFVIHFISLLDNAYSTVPNVETTIN